MADTRTEHFVTLFDNGFLPQGMALHASLVRQGGDFVLWVICMDEAVERNLQALALPRLRTIPLCDVEREQPRLLDVKAGRGRGEYCWTLTPFSHEAVFARDPSAQRVTYLDADLYFFGPPERLLAEMDKAGADVLLTDHAYAPEYRQDETSGRFCVQFLPFRRTDKGMEILRWWQDRCIEWCFGRFEDGKFGDQKYLDEWPTNYPRAVHVLEDVALTLAPWNAGRLLANGEPRGIYHFHNLRIMESGLVRLWLDYLISPRVKRLVYKPYINELRAGRRLRRNAGVHVDLPVPPRGFIEWLRRRVRSRRGTEGWAHV